MEKIVFNWSTGKDSALALYKLLQNNSYTVEHLLTSVNKHHDRVSMHGIRRSLLYKQAEELGIPLSTIELPEQPTMEEYENIMSSSLHHIQSKEIHTAAFGDIFLDDLKAYREQQLNKIGMKALFPLWKQDTTALLHEFIALGFKSVVVCVKSQLLNKSFVGKTIDHDFIADLPKNVDPCGENGEFHTFCYDGPIFKNPINFTIGKKVFRTYQNPNANNDVCKTDDKLGFWFCDLIQK